MHWDCITASPTGPIGHFSGKVWETEVSRSKWKWARYCSNITGSAFSLEKGKTKDCLQLEATSWASSISAYINLTHTSLFSTDLSLVHMHACHTHKHAHARTHMHTHLHMPGPSTEFCLHCFVSVEYWAGTDRPYLLFSWCLLYISALFVFLSTLNS